MRAETGCKTALLAVIVSLAALTAREAAFAQTAVATDEAQQQLVEQIRGIQAREGVHSEALIDPLTQLAMLLEQSGDDALAIAVIDQALDVVLNTRGLHSLDQLPLLRQAIRAEEARGNLSGAGGREQELLEVARRHPSDLQTVSIFREAADKRMAFLARLKIGEDYERCDSIFPLECTMGALNEARPLYAEAIEVILRNHLYSSDELRELEASLVRTVRDNLASTFLNDPTHRDSGAVLSNARRRENCFAAPPGWATHWDKQTDSEELHPGDPRMLGLIADRLDWLESHDAPGESATERDGPEGLPTRGSIITLYSFVRRSLLRSYNYEVASAAPALAQVNAFLQVADWDLLYDCNSIALKEYERAYAWLRETRAVQAIEESFSPHTPVVLPTFEPNPFASAAAEESTGYVDVAFTITKLGEPQRVTVVEATPAATDDAKERIVTLIKRSRFRPRVVDDVFGRTSRVVVRYPLSNLP